MNTKETLEDGSDTEDEPEADTEMEKEATNQRASRLAMEKSQTMMSNKRANSELLVKRAVADNTVVYR